MSTWLGLTLIDWIVILIFLFSIAILGILAYGRVHDRSDFFLGGRRFGKVFMIFSPLPRAPAATMQCRSWRVPGERD